MLFIHKWGHIVSAEPASACCSFATKKEEVDQEKEDVTRVTPKSLQGACTPRGTNIWTGTPETSPETDPPQEKRAKREAVAEDLEEGELMDSSDEENEEEGEGNAEEKTPCSESCDGAKDTTIQDEPADSVNVNDGINKHSDSSRDQCLNEDNSGLKPLTIQPSAEVSMTKEDAAKEPGPVHTRHCPDENESANAADSCGLEW